MKKCTIIYNEQFIKELSDKKIKQIEELLSNNDYESNIIKSENIDSIKNTVEKLEDTDLLISIGDDATFNEVINGNLKRQNELLLAHLPVKTTDIGTIYGYKSSIIRNLKMLLKSEIKEVDLYNVNKEIFTYSFGIGKFIDISYSTLKNLKKTLGHKSYKEYMKQKTPLYNLKLQVDNKFYSESCSIILVSNSNKIVGIKNFYKDIKLDDEEFEILICNLTDKKRIIKSLASLKKKDVSSIYGFKSYKAKYLKIFFDNSLEKTWNLDGKEYETKSKSYEISRSKQIKMLVPKKNIKKLFM